MRWLSFLLLAGNTAAAQGARGAKPLRFDFALMAETRDSFVLQVRGEQRGWAVWQYELRSDETGQEVLYTARSELRPVESESLRIVVNRLTGAPVASFQRLRSEEHTSELQSRRDLVCRLLLEKKKKKKRYNINIKKKKKRKKKNDNNTQT